jgi:hypothetical protein
MVDWDGQFQYSGVVSVENSCIFKTIPIKIYPNPVVNDVTIELTEGKTHKINVYNATGSLRLTTTADKTITIDMSQWASGIYVVEVIDQRTGDGYMQKVVK